VSIYNPQIFFDQIEKKFGVDQGAYQFGFDAIPSGRYFGGVFRTLAGLGLGSTGVPVGRNFDRRDIGQQPSPSVSPVVSGPSIVPPTNVPETIVTRAPAPRPQELPTKNEEPMDLGNLVKDLATTYLETRYAQPGTRAGSPIMATPVGLPAIIGGGLSRMGPSGLGAGIGGGIFGGLAGDLMSGIESFGGGMGGCNNPSDIVFKWSPQAQDYVPQKRRKRRRKQLVTQSDIKGLAALKGVVGTGKIMETWIATHA
jgi:hypothetical protein